MKNIKHKSLIVVALVLALLSVVTAAFSQTTPGVLIGVSTRTLDVATTPTKGYLHAKFGYEGGVLGLAATYMTDSKARIKQSSMVGAELTATLLHIDAINLKAGVEGQYLLRERRAWRNLAFTPSLKANTTILKHLEAEFAVLGFYHREVFKASRETPGAKGIIDRWRICQPGAEFGFTYKF